MKLKYSTLLFDLDGTLTDSGEGIIKSVQYALKHFGIIENDMDKIVNGGSKGYYYAKVTMDPKHYNLKVMTVHFVEARLPEVIGSVSDYKTNNLHFIESALLSSGYICGTCSSEKNSTNGYVGGIGSYFMNL